MPSGGHVGWAVAFLYIFYMRVRVSMKQPADLVARLGVGGACAVTEVGIDRYCNRNETLV